MKTKIINAPLVVILMAAMVTMGFTWPFAKKEVQWLEWNEGYKKAQRKERKILLVDAYTDWCGWCKRMDQNTYTHKDVIKLVNKKFIPVKFNPEKDQRYFVDGDTLNGRQLLRKMSNGRRVGYPTTFFIDISDNKVKKVSGYKGPQQFVAVLEEAMAWAKEE